MDIDPVRLLKRVRELVESGADSGKPARNEYVRSLVDAFSDEIRAELIRFDVMSVGIKSGDDCDECLGTSKLVKAKIVGSGAFGTVFDVGGGRVVKVEQVSDANPVIAGTDARRAGEIGIGPKVHGHHTCQCGPLFYVLTEMDMVKGKTLDDWMTPLRDANSKRNASSKSRLENVRRSIKSKLAKMHKAGMAHKDLHGGNVIVDRNDEPWFVDWSYTAGEPHALRVLDYVTPGIRNPEARMWDRIESVFAALVREGTVRITSKLPVSSMHAVFNSRGQHAYLY